MGTSISTNVAGVDRSRTARVVIAVLAALVVLMMGDGVTLPASGSTTWSYNFTQSPGSPLTFTGDSQMSANVHTRATGGLMQPTLLGHGADCSAPPAQHPVQALDDGIFICKAHLMTGVTDAGYGQANLTPAALADFSQGTAVITFAVSTLHTNPRDWLAFWLTPFDQNLVHPFDQAVDLNGPPRNAVEIQGSGAAPNSSFFGTEFSNFAFSPQFGHGGTVEGALAAAGLSPSAAIRMGFEIDISQTHIRFGIPSLNAWFIDNNLPTPLPFTQALVQFGADSYDTCKDQAISPSNPCTTTDTWHWSSFAINPAVPFYMSPGDVHQISQQGQVVHFATAAPAGSFLRFEAIGTLGTTTQVSFNGGSTYQNATPQAQNGDHGAIHEEHFSSYWMPVPAGTSQVLFKGQGGWWGHWWVRSPEIWSLNGGGQPAPTPSPSPSPTPSAAPSPSPSPSPSPIPINGMPCVVTINGAQISGTCSGTFTPH
jgi:hypothetical protein